MARVIFMGTPDFAVPALKAIVAAGHEVVLVVSQPDRRVGRGKKLRSPAVIEAARELGLPTSQPRAIRSGSFPVRVLSLCADVAVVIAYGRILTEELLHAPKWGCVNVHGSLLPRWRGAAPLQAAILAGDSVTGVCTQRMELGLDTGPIYCEESITLASDETAGSLHDRLSDLSASIAVRTLSMLPDAVPVAQSSEGVCYAEKIDRTSGLLSWSSSAESLDRQIRAMTPWPGGWIPWRKGPLKVLKASVVEGSGQPGELLSVQPDLVVATAAGALRLDRLCAPGKRPVDGRSFANGAHLLVGQTLVHSE